MGCGASSASVLESEPKATAEKKISRLFNDEEEDDENDVTKVAKFRRPPPSFLALREGERARSPRPESSMRLQCAVSLEWLLRVFLTQHPQVAERRMTSSQVCAHACDLSLHACPTKTASLHKVVTDIVIPATKTRTCRFVNFLIGQGLRSSVSSGRPFYFVSHCWSRPFLELVEMIREHFSEGRQRIWRPHGEGVLSESEIFCWIDIFAINQHPGSSQYDLRNLKYVLEGAQRTLMVLDRSVCELSHEEIRQCSRHLCLFAFQAWRGPDEGLVFVRSLANSKQEEQCGSSCDPHVRD